MAGVTEPILWGRQFSDIFQDAMDRIKADAPDYTALLPSDPGIAVLDALLYQQALLGEALNLLPSAALVAWVNYLGIAKKGPVAASGSVRVTLESGRTVQISIPTGTQFLDENGLAFVAATEIIVDPGTDVIDCPVTCTINGAVGNVAANSVIHIYQRLPYVIDCTNPQPMAGGFDSELDADTLDRGRKIITHLWRAVGVTDFEELARYVPGIAKARCIDQEGMVSLYILAADGQPANSDLCSQAIAYLTPIRCQGVGLQCLPAVLHAVSIQATVRLQAGYALATVQSLITARLSERLQPLNWDWGRKVSISEILATMEETQGVDYVDELILPQSNIVLAPYELATLAQVVIYAA